MNFEDLKGKTLTKIQNNEDSIDLECEDGSRFRLYHDQDCCESVRVEEVIGDLADLIGRPLLQAEEVSNADAPEDRKHEYNTYDDSETWTFYKLATIKGSVTIRWLGESNGYYSESVSFAQLK